MFGIEERSYEPKNFFAGEFPTVPETGTAGAAIAERTPVTTDANGNIIAVAAETVANVIGISAMAAAASEPVVYYMTGEFFTDAINVPNGVDADALKAALRKISIFLR
jgi:hypothetical protein